MKTLCLSGALAIWLGVAVLAQSTPGAQQGPDVSGRWNREAVSGQPDLSRWGGRVQIDQAGSLVMVRPESGKTERYRLDGKETAEVIETKGCRAKIRIAKATATPTGITITTWIVDKPVCVHGEDPDDPMFPSLGAV